MGVHVNDSVLFMFVQPGAKINSVYYCDHILEQGLLSDIHHLSIDDFLFQKWGKIDDFCQIQHNFTCSEDLKPGKEYLNAPTCKFYTFSRQNLQILTYHMPFYH